VGARAIFAKVETAVDGGVVPNLWAPRQAEIVRDVGMERWTVLVRSAPVRMGAGLRLIDGW
jgi:hypothetical protein